MKQEFYAVLKKDAPGSWTLIEIPFDVEQVFKAKGYIQVKGTIEDIHYSGIRLMPTGNGRYWMPVNEQLRKKMKRDIGDTVSVTMEADNTVIEYTEPDDFITALETNKTAKTFYESLTKAQKKWYILNITEAKQEATKKTRIEKAIERLATGKKFHD